MVFQSIVIESIIKARHLIYSQLHMKITHLVLSSLLGFCLSSSLGVAGQSDFSISDLKKELKNEFTNSYPEQQKPTGKIKSFELVAAENNIGIIPPYKTLVWAYNGMVPGPVIRIKLGDTLQLKLINNFTPGDNYPLAWYTCAKCDGWCARSHSSSSSVG